MHRLFGNFGWSMIFAVSVACLTVAIVLPWARSRGRAPTKQRTARVLMVAFSLMTAALVFSPVTAAHHRRFLDLDLWRGIQTATIDRVMLFESIGNMLLLAWLAVLLPLAFRRIGALRAVAICTLVSIGIEIIQYVIAVGRVSSITDVFFNVLGAAVAAGIGRVTWQTRIRPVMA